MLQHLNILSSRCAELYPRPHAGYLDTAQNSSGSNLNCSRT
jgi:hypothetical protein